MADDDQPIKSNDDKDDRDLVSPEIDEEPELDDLEEEEDTSEEVLNAGQYFDDISDDSVRLHLREIGKIPLLTAEEELALAQRVKAGEKRAKDKMAEANKAFAHYRW